MSSVSQSNIEGRIEQVLARVEDAANRDTILEYLHERRAQNKAPGTVVNEGGHLADLAIHLEGKGFREAERKDLVAFMNRRAWVREYRSRRKDGSFSTWERPVQLSDRTMECRGVVVKCFYRWLEGDDDEYPKKVRFIKSGGTVHKTLPTDTLVTPDDLQVMLKAAEDRRERTALAVLYESGMRSSELCSLNVGSVQFEEWGALLTLPTKGKNLKTGPRQVMIFRNESEPYLHAWYEDHPHKDDPGFPLFYGVSRRAPKARMTPSGVWDLVTRTAKKAGIRKKISPKLFRHTAATMRAKEGWTEGMMRGYFGWTKSSEMPATYVHLAQLDYQEMALAKKGFKSNGSGKPHSGLAPLICRGCKAENMPTAAFCGECRTPLTPKGALDLKRRQDEVLAEMVREEVQRVLTQAMD
jgi:integrase/ribosomal protein L40E